MKFSLIIPVLIVCYCSAFSQIRTSKSDTVLYGKLKAIDRYVAWVNQRKDLNIIIQTDLSTDNSETSHTMYSDPKTDLLYKLEDKLRTRYYQTSQMIYEEIRDTIPHNKTYYENGKILYTTYNIDAEQILEITYKQTTGGDRGGFTLLRITKDSLLYSCGWYPVKNKANKIKNWTKLIQLLKISDFEKVNSGKSELYIDGADEYIEIVSTHHRFTILNGRTDPNHYKMIISFIRAVTNLMQKAAD